MPGREHDAIPEWVCGTCRRPVGTYTDDGVITAFLHPFDVVDDHPVIAVRTEETGGEVVTTCDFCSEASPRWVYPCHDFDALPGQHSVGAWAACERCHLLIEQARWRKLVTRALVGQRRDRNDPATFVLEALLGELFRQFARHRTGRAWPRW
jgi:hypothetical protein